MFDKLKHNTKLPESYHKAFLKELGATETSSKELFLNRQKFSDTLLNRKRYLNKHFNFSKANVLKFEKLCSKLTHIQEEIITKHIHITKQAEKELIENGGQFTDIEIKIDVQFMSKVLDDVGAIYETSHIYCYDFTNEESLKHTNKDYSGLDYISGTKQVFTHFHQSRLFHHLLIESPLALQDILLIDRIWFDIKIEYQTCNVLK